MKRCRESGGHGPEWPERVPLIGDHTPQGPFNGPEIRVRGQLTSEAVELCAVGVRKGSTAAFRGLWI